MFQLPKKWLKCAVRWQMPDKCLVRVACADDTWAALRVPRELTWGSVTTKQSYVLVTLVHPETPNLNPVVLLPDQVLDHDPYLVVSPADLLDYEAKVRDAEGQTPDYARPAKSIRVGDHRPLLVPKVFPVGTLIEVAGLCQQDGGPDCVMVRNVAALCVRVDQLGETFDELREARAENAAADI